jgi:hypothetical protein
MDLTDGGRVLGQNISEVSSMRDIPSIVVDREFRSKQRVIFEYSGIGKAVCH